MKKLNKKGYVLVETLIVTVFVVTLFIIIYQTTVPALGEYDQQNKYDDIDSVYYSNLYKQMVTRYANLDAINAYLANTSNNYYVDITNCTGKIGTEDIYKDVNYCKLVQESIGIGKDDRILLTDYDLTNFKNVVNNDVDFDSGAYSNFRNYLDTVAAKQERFVYRAKDTNEIGGKYRLFLIRQIKESDSSTTRRYANIGIYVGSYAKYLQGELVHYKVNDSEDLAFYVLKNSSSTDANLTLILADNLKNGSNYINTYFNNTATNNPGKNLWEDWGWRTNKLSTDASTVSNNIGYPDLLLTQLWNKTDSWSNVPNLTGEYKADDCVGKTGCYEYVISYVGHKARLLQASEILEIVGCREDGTTCFDKNSAFEIEFDTTRLGWLVNNLSGDQGYWTSDVVHDSSLYAWSIQNGKVVPTTMAIRTDNATTGSVISIPNVGIRPVIVVRKDNANLRRG